VLGKLNLSSLPILPIGGRKKNCQGLPEQAAENISYSQSTLRKADNLIELPLGAVNLHCKDFDVAVILFPRNEEVGHRY
jgi:hypothetical protein